jgi:hypothetical protein
MTEALFTDKQFTSIQYKTGINGLTNSSTTNNIDSIDQLLAQETVSNVADSWARLDKTTRIKKLKTYVRTKMNARMNLTDQESDKCLRYMVRNMDRQLRRVKDVVYDKDSGEVMDIPAFEFNAKTRAFTMKRDSPNTTPVKKRVARATRTAKVAKVAKAATAAKAAKAAKVVTATNQSIANQSIANQSISV